MLVFGVGLALECVTGVKDVTANGVEAIMDALVQKPVSVVIETGSVFLHLYSGGVMTFWCDTNLDHGVLVVGNGTDKWGGDPETQRPHLTVARGRGPKNTRGG